MEAAIFIAFPISCFIVFIGRTNFCTALLPSVFAVCTLEYSCWNQFKESSVFKWFLPPNRCNIVSQSLFTGFYRHPCFSNRVILSCWYKQGVLCAVIAKNEVVRQDQKAPSSAEMEFSKLSSVLVITASLGHTCHDLW